MKTITFTLLTFVMFNADAITVEIFADKDNTLYETAAGDLSNGAGEYFFAGRTNQTVGQSIRRGLLHFDLASLPAGAVINDVTLELNTTLSNNLPTTVSLHDLTSSWGGGTSDAPGGEGSGTTATTGDATWTQNFFGSSSWLAPGGDYNIISLASASVTSVGAVTFNHPSLTTQVQNWLTTPVTNRGLIVIGDENTSSTAVRFNSRENAAGQPKLIIDYDLTIAVQAEFNPVKDNTLYETDTGNTSNGVGDRLFIGKTGASAGFKKRRAVLEFDLSSIPSVATIDSVQLDLQVTNTAPGAISFDADLYLLLDEWGEGTSIGSGNGDSATTNDATWLHNFFNTSTWNNEGGDFVLLESGSTSVGTSNGETISFASTGDMVADVQLWVQNESMNHGWIILGDELTDQNARGLSSREGLNPPVLTVDYTVPDLIFENGFE